METTQSLDLPPVSQLTPEERTALLLKFRMEAAKRKLTAEEAHYAISLLRHGRSVATASSSKAKAKAAAPSASLEDF